MADAEAKAPEATCCPPGSFPALKERDAHVPKGSMRKTADGKELYVSGDASSGKGLIVIYDVHGLPTGRIHGVADTFADSGLYVVIPDIYEGSAVGLHGGFQTDTGKAWLTTQNWPKCEAYIEAALAHMEAAGVTSVGIVGFCWGGWVMAHAGANPRLKCGMSMHPSLGITALHGEDPEELARAVRFPVMLMPAANDPDNVKPGGSVVKILEAGAGVEVVEFPAVMHGFVTRGDVSDATVAANVERALQLGVEFLGKHL